MSKYWIKLYYEILDNHKMGRLTDRLFRRAIECFLIAGDNKKCGELPHVEQMAWRLRCNERELENELVELEKRGILNQEDGKYFVTNFSAYQMAMSDSQRARRWREKNRGVNWAKRLYKGLPAKPGVYRLICKNTGKYYVGATNNIYTRTKQHLYHISKDDHPMSEDVLTFGVESLEIEILELVDDESELAERERYWIGKYPKDDLYNTHLVPIEHEQWRS